MQQFVSATALGDTDHRPDQVIVSAYGLRGGTKAIFGLSLGEAQSLSDQLAKLDLGEQQAPAARGSDFTTIGQTVMRFGERIAEARNAANAQLIAKALNAYNPPDEAGAAKGNTLIDRLRDVLIDDGGYPRFTVAHGEEFDAIALEIMEQQA